MKMAEKKQADKDPRNVMVKALRPHQNTYGAKFEKATNDTYVPPRPAGDIACGVVELVDDAKSSPVKTGPAADALKV